MGRITEFLGLRRNLVLLLVAIVAIGAGEEMWVRFLPKYLESLGASVAVIGLFDAIKTLLGAVYAYPGGVMTDRWGHRRALVLFNLISIAGYLVVLIYPRWIAVIGGMFLFLAWSNLSLPANFSLVGATLAQNQLTMGIGVQSLIKRVPILIGPVVGGALLERYGVVNGVRAGVAVSIVLGVATIFVQRGIEETGRARESSGASLTALIRAFDPRLRRLLWSDILIRFCERLPYAWIVLYAMDHVGVSAIQFGVLTGIEMATAIACYVPVARLADRYGREPFVIATFVFFTLFPLSLWAAHSFAALAGAFVIRGLKEFGDPARKALIVHYAPVEGRAATIGAYYLIRDTTVSLGAFAGAALWKISPEANFLAAAAIGAVGTAVYCWTLRRV
jgi:MFS family permease